MVKHLFYIICTCLLLFSCSLKKSKDKDNTIQELPTIQLQGEYLKCDSDIWGMKIDFIDENQFLIEELSQNKLYAIYELNGNSLRKKGSFLTKGNGAWEVINPSYQVTDSSLFIANYSGTISKVYKIRKEYPFDKDKWEVVDMPLNHNCLLFPNFVMFNDSICIATGGELTDNKILSAINFKRNKVEAINYTFPGINVATYVKSADFLVYCDAKLAKHPSLSKFVYTCRLGRFIEILEMDGTHLSKRIPLCADYPVYKASNDRRVIDDRCLRGAVTKVTENYIYCLMTPYTHGEALKENLYKGLPNYFSDILYVFNWDGKLLYKYTLDMPVCSFCIDRNDKYMFASTMKGEDFVIRKYKLDLD